MTGNPFGEREDKRQVQNCDEKGCAYAAVHTEPESGEDNRQKVNFPQKNVAVSFMEIGLIMKNSDTNDQQGEYRSPSTILFSD